ncbi:MAG: beta-Ala-His dipeptidase, partial [Bacteroidales bacterium]|nr:beta-Ala-His dipeptidase [Bacteroidales bacterium]
MRARGTTLGADNGIAVAMALAVLAADDIKHGPIECLFTVDEEVGLVGASGIEPGLLQGKTLINLDSEDDHWVCIGCAGGINTLAQFAYETMETPAGMYYFKVGITGLKGGHSGTDINAGRGNANQLLVRFLYEEAQQNELYISSLQGGNLSNAIPREAACIAAVPFASKEQLRVRLNLFEAALQAEFGKNEPDLKLTLDSIDAPAAMLKPEYATRFLQSMYACPNGVIRMNKDMPEQVDTSTNLASVKPTAGKENEWTIVTSQRSSIESSKIDVVNRIRAIFELAGMTTTHTEGYPGWAPNTESPLLKVMVDVHKEMYGEAPVVYAIHAGLECGLFLQKYPDWDMVSIGPTMRGVHSPDECLYVPSVESVWNYLLAILERL